MKHALTEGKKHTSLDFAITVLWKKSKSFCVISDANGSRVSQAQQTSSVVTSQQKVEVLGPT